MWDFLKNSQNKLKELQSNIEQMGEARESLKLRVDDFNTKVEEEARRAALRAEQGPPLALMDLPDDVLFHVLQLAPVRLVCRMARTCKRLRGIAYEESLWRRLCQNHWSGVGPDHPDAALHLESDSKDGEDRQDDLFSLKQRKTAADYKWQQTCVWRAFYCNRHQSKGRAARMLQWLKKFNFPPDLASRSQQAQLMDALRCFNSFLRVQDWRTVDDLVNLSAIDSWVSVLQNRSEGVREQAAIALACLSLRSVYAEAMKGVRAEHFCWKALSLAKSDDSVRNISRTLVNVMSGAEAAVGTTAEIFMPKVDSAFLQSGKYLGYHYYGGNGGSDGNSYMDIGFDRGEAFGFGWDKIGRFEIGGSYTVSADPLARSQLARVPPGGVRLTKSYGTASSGHSHVKMQGFFDTSFIFGVWEVSAKSRGFFALHPITEEEFFEQEGKFAQWNSIQNIVAHWEGTDSDRTLPLARPALSDSDED